MTNNPEIPQDSASNNNAWDELANEPGDDFITPSYPFNSPFYFVKQDESHERQKTTPQKSFTEQYKNAVPSFDIEKFKNEHLDWYKGHNQFPYPEHEEIYYKFANLSLPKKKMLIANSKPIEQAKYILLFAEYTTYSEQIGFQTTTTHLVLKDYVQK